MNHVIAAFAAFGMILTACGGDDEDNAGRETADSDQSAIDNGLFGDNDDQLAVDNRDAEGNQFATEESAADSYEAPAATEAPAESAQPMEYEESAPAAEAGSATDSASSGRNTAAPDGGDAEGGLFGGDAESDVSDEARFEDNTFRDYGYRDFVDTDDDPLSTFALDVDTGSYTIARRWLDEGSLPPIESVRPEEYVNAFEYDYRAPRRGLDLTVDGGPSPFDDDNYLVRVGVQGEVVDDDERGPAALTFVVDTSGSMDRDDRLGLVKRSLEILVDELEDDDTVAIVTYADNSGVVLYPTPVSERSTILSAIDDLRPGGSTNLEAGLRTGYGLADEAFRDGGINRVVLASDGVANVGMTDPTQLAQLISDDAARGIDLVTVGFGMGNFNDVTMEQLADQGDGFYAYVDTEDEAERVFEDQLTSTLLTVAKNAKIQVEFDPQIVESYRLIGFENRGVHDSDFRNDAVDAGELGAGHQVTAIYEVQLERGIDIADRDDIGQVYLRWEDPDGGDVEEIDDDIRLGDVEPDWTRTPEDFRLAIVVATFAELMRDNPYADAVDIDDLADEAERLADEIDDRQVDELAALIGAAADLR